VTIRQQLQEIFRNVLDVPFLVLHENMTAAEVDNWDSVAHINLMFAIESEFTIQFSSAEFAELTDVGALEKLIARKKQGASYGAAAY
jgi:acyl carrier protein